MCRLYAMFRLRFPSEPQLAGILERANAKGFNHPAVTPQALTAPPQGFIVDEYGAPLGSGEGLFKRAVQAIEAFRMYPPSWTRIYAPQSPFTLGAPFLSLTRQLGVWAVLPGRIIETVDETTEQARTRSFAFGTLHGHAETGVERFGIRWDLTTDQVHYEVRAISRTIGLTRLATPIARHFQTTFHRQSPRALQSALAAREPG